MPGPGLGVTYTTVIEEKKDKTCCRVSHSPVGMVATSYYSKNHLARCKITTKYLTNIYERGTWYHEIRMKTETRGSFVGKRLSFGMGPVTPLQPHLCFHGWVLPHDHG